jgi:hypothetical protein
MIDYHRMNMDTSDSSDDEKNPVVGKTSKLKIADVVIRYFSSKWNEKVLLYCRWLKMMNILQLKKKRKKPKQMNR